MIRYPRPVSEPIHSETIAPITHDVVAILSAENRKGSDEGSRSLKRTCALVADSTRINSKAEGSTASRPRTMFTRVGKNEIRAAITTFPTLVNMVRGLEAEIG